MREHRRAGWALTKLAFRAAPLHTSVAFTCFLLRGVGTALDAWWLARLVDAVVAGDGHRAAVAALGLAITGSVTIALAMLDVDLRFRIEEATGLLVDQEIIATMATTATLELHERPAHLDRIEVLRAQKAMVAQSVSAILEFLAVFATAGTALGLLARISPLLLLIPTGGLVAVLVSARSQVAEQRLVDQLAEGRRRATHLFRIGTEAGPAKELRTFGVAPEIVSRHDQLFGETCEAWERLSLRWGVRLGLSWSLLGVVQILAVAFVAWRAVDGTATVGDVVLVLTLNDQVNAIIQQGVGLTSWLFGSLRAADRYLEVIDAATALGTGVPREPAPVPASLHRGIELEGVGFTYGDARQPVLHDVDITIPAGAIVALVGENGAGKSTLVKLLAGFYAPTTGTIRVDGIDLTRFEAATWRARLSGAFQDHARFELVASEVVGIGDLERISDRPAIEEALVRAGGVELTASLDRGLETPLGRSFDEGIEPSGGQWQQLALGRALLRDGPLLLLLDEPTSALDPEAEHDLFTGYAEAARRVAAENGAVTVLVSHRFSTVRMADLIVVLADGTVEEAGTHAELMAAGGTYAELFAMQARAYR